MLHLQDFDADFLMFLECGFIAISQLDETSAKDLFHVAKMIQPHNTLLMIADGYMHFTKMQLDAAAKSFEEVLKKEPGNEMAKTFLGLTYSLTPKTMEKGEKILKETGAHSHDPAIKKLSTDSVAFVDVHLKQKIPHQKGQ
jgi:predicted Zn-dependent protease